MEEISPIKDGASRLDDQDEAGETHDEQEEAIEEIEEHQISKRELKRRIKNVDWKEKRMAKRLKERERRRQKKQQKSAESTSNASLELTEDGGAVIKKRRMKDPEASDIRVAIDCTFDDLMNDLDMKKLCKQLQRCYAENRNVNNKPLQFYICGLAGRFQEISDHVISGYKSWDVHWRTDGPEAAFGKQNIVYLAAESPNILTELRPDRVYIIGGLVDHNHHKNHCYSLAVERGWSHAQLPISEYVKLRDRKVLVINHVFEILLAFIKTNDWKEAFLKVLPQRKVAAFKDLSEAVDGEVEGHESAEPKGENLDKSSHDDKKAVLKNQSEVASEEVRVQRSSGMNFEEMVDALENQSEVASE
ncbi:tRNA methyltransferase 10 homolog A-like [Asterias amurensis]|uniref:tRNA methyltransferase 10 homolog A-like n=1 Tax=Asterias amurensis TaxID=7602 RepID=UPI003AB3934F